METNNTSRPKLMTTLNETHKQITIRLEVEKPPLTEADKNHATG